MARKLKAGEPGNTPRAAQPITDLASPNPFRGSVSSRDRFDYYSFSLTKSSSFNLTLTNTTRRGIATNVDVDILDSGSKILQQGRLAGRRPEVIKDDSLDPGTYYVKVIWRKGNSRYQFILSASPLVVVPILEPPPDIKNTPPTLSVNKGATVAKGGTVLINGSVLAATDREQTAANQLIYTLTSAPENGNLQRSDGTVLGSGSTFTQADLNAGLVGYKSSPTDVQLSAAGSNPRDAQISGANVVWVGSDGKGNDAQIFYYNGSKVTQLKPEGLPDNIKYSLPQISGSQAVWEGFDGNDSEIFYYDGSKTIQLTNNNTDDFSPQISDSGVVWEGIDGDDSDIFFYNGSNILQLTANATGDTSPKIAGSNVAWVHFNGIKSDVSTESDIFYYNASVKGNITVYNLTETSTSASSLQVSDTRVVWAGISSDNGTTDKEIFYFTGQGVALGDTDKAEGTPLTRNSFEDDSPQVSGARITWVGFDGTTNQIFYSSPGNTSQDPAIQLTQDSFNKSTPRISGSGVVWDALVDDVDSEVFYYNGDPGLSPDVIRTTQLTTNNTQDTILGVSGSDIFWTGFDGTGYEILRYSNGSRTSLTTGGTLNSAYLLQTSGSNLAFSNSSNDTGLFYRNFSRSDSFAFAVADGKGGSIENTFNIVVIPI